MCHGECFAGIATDIRVGCAEFEVVAVHLQANLARTHVRHGNDAADLVLQVLSVGLHGAFEVLRNHGAVVRIRTFVQLGDNLRGIRVEEDVRRGGADFDVRIALGDMEDVLQHLLRDDDAVLEVGAFLVDAGAAQAVTVGRDHGNLSVLGFQIDAVQVEARGVGGSCEQGLLGEEREFASREVQGLAVFNFGERREVACVKTGDRGLALLAPLDLGEVVLHVETDGCDARVHQVVDKVGELACVNDDRAISFALDFDLDPDTEVEVGCADFEEIAFEAQGEVVEHLNGGLVRHGGNGRFQNILKNGFVNRKLHGLCTSLYKHCSYEKHYCDNR